jgi:hypothetical protein
MSYRISTRQGHAVGPSRDRVGGGVRALILLGTAVRLAYGVGALLAPERMVGLQFAPSTHELPEPRLLLRAFGGHQIVTGIFTLASLRSRRLARAASTVSLAIDALDVSSAILEIPARGESDRATIAGIALSGTGVLTFAAARCALSR